jgi:RNA polymerase sigma factor (sigma-70 family)
MSPFISVRLLQTQSDERLLAGAREGHEPAFEALVQRYRRPLLRYCRRLLLPQERAEDVVQQALFQAWLALQRGAEVRDAKAWLFRVTHNAAIDSLRTSGYDHEQLSESLRGASAPESDLERRTAVRQALAGLATLPELQREALLRTAVGGHSHGQVAAALGLSDGAVRGLVYRARATLRASATALTPSPLFAWAASVGHRGAPLAQRLGGVGAGAGAAGATGATGALIKGGAAFLTAGALVAGAVTVVHHSSLRHKPHPAGSTRGAGGRVTHEGVHLVAARDPAPGRPVGRGSAAAASTPAVNRVAATVETAGGQPLAPRGEARPGAHANASPGRGDAPAGGEVQAAAEAHGAEAVVGAASTAGGSSGGGAGAGAGQSGAGPGPSGASGGAGAGTPSAPTEPSEGSDDGSPSAPASGSDDGSSGGSAPPGSGSGTTGTTGPTGPTAPELDGHGGPVHGESSAHPDSVPSAAAPSGGS